VSVPATCSFDAAIAVTSDGPGRFEAQLHPDWDGPFLPNGGILAAILLRAARTELGRPDLPPRTLSVHYPRPARHGAATVTAAVLREGRSSALVRVELHQDERLVCTALVTSTTARHSPISLRKPAPRFPPLDSVEPGEPPAPPPMMKRLDMRPSLGDAPFTSSAEAMTGGWLGLRDDDRLVDAELITTFCDAWWPPIFATLDRLMAVPTLELTVHFRHTAPVEGPVFARFKTTTLHEGHYDETGELWAADGTLIAESGQIAMLLPI
jgi:acyl-CoA thioesterase